MQEATTTSEPTAVRHRRWSENSVVKMVVLGLLVVILMIPLGVIALLVEEREGRQRGVRAEIASFWGHEQTLVGPILSVPYRLFDPNSKKTTLGTGTFLPIDVEWHGTLNPQVRNRGIFETVVYEAELMASGEFRKLSLPQWQHENVTVLWELATISVGISDVGGLQSRTVLHWGDTEVGFVPGASSVALNGGIHVGVPGLELLEEGTVIPFKFDLSLRGSRRLAVVPVGEVTRLTLDSSWNDPGFDGAFAPASRELGKEGFTASWEVPYFGRDFPQSWDGDSVSYARLTASAFGAELVLPADGYQQTTRSVKYSVLFILLTFVTFFLIEVVSPVRLHAAQYLLVGFALCLFYVLLLALSEHLGFGPAYAAATGAIVLLIAGYGKSILASSGWAVVLGSCLAALYGYLYVLLQLEEYALILGAVGLLMILALIMYVTRNLNWTTLRFAELPAEAS